MLSTCAVPKWREWDILHPVQGAREARQAEVEGVRGRRRNRERGWALSGLQRHPQGEDREWRIRRSAPLQMGISSPRLRLPSSASALCLGIDLMSGSTKAKK